MMSMNELSDVDKITSDIPKKKKKNIQVSFTNLP